MYGSLACSNRTHSSVLDSGSDFFLPRLRV
jgi:hypothetical protein